jgi:hypothetical protein
VAIERQFECTSADHIPPKEHVKSAGERELDSCPGKEITLTFVAPVGI